MGVGSGALKLLYIHRLGPFFGVKHLNFSGFQEKLIFLRSENCLRGHHYILCYFWESNVLSVLRSF